MSAGLSVKLGLLLALPLVAAVVGTVLSSNALGPAVQRSATLGLSEAEKGAVAEVHAQATARTTRILFGVASVCLLSLVLGIAFTRRSVVGSLRRLEAQARRLAGGDFSQRADVDTADELSELGAAINQLTEDFGKSLGKKTQLLQAVNASGDAIFITDRDGVITFINGGFTRLYGYLPEEVVGKATPRILKSGLMTPEASKAIWRALLDGTGSRSEHQNKTRDGRLITVESAASPMRDGAGAVTGFLAIQHDVTERNELRSGLAKSDRLASIGMLAAGVAHEINNPLTYVLANLDTLAHDLPAMMSGGDAEIPQASASPPSRRAAVAQLTADELMECAHSALEGIHRIQSIARGLGAFSRVHKGDLTRVDLNRVMNAAAMMANNEVKYRATLVRDFGKVRDIVGSEGKLAQVFLNLIINAAHAIGPGHVNEHRITLRTWDEGEDVFAEVADTGHGIPPENLDQIFEAFFTTKKVGSGTGLGLAISKSIVTEMGGDIRVESQVGKGTRFILRLPAFVAASTRHEATQDSARPLPVTRRGRILVVDDELPIRTVLQRILGTRHDVVAVSSGEEGRALLEKDPAFDVILCDLMMASMTGMELHAWLAEHLPQLAARVVFVTGGAFTPGASGYVAGTGNRRIEKPFAAEDIQRVCAEFILAPPAARA